MLPLYFKHDNLRSFIRQLNIYGFQRCPNASGRDRTMEFFHPMFTRNGARNLKDIKRGNQSKKNDTVEDGVDEVEQPQACPQFLVALPPPRVGIRHPVSERNQRIIITLSNATEQNP